MKKYLHYTAVFFTVLFLLLNCRSPNEPLPLRSPELGSPVVTGLIITRESGPDPIAVWGEPTLPEESDLLKMNTPYPNPAHLGAFISYYVSKTMHIRMWAVEAVYEGDKNTTITSSNGVFQSIGGMTAITFVDGERQAGWYDTHFYLTGENSDLPNGFYRIYLQGEDVLLWQDLFIYRDTEEEPVPPIVRTIYGDISPGERW